MIKRKIGDVGREDLEWHQTSNDRFNTFGDVRCSSDFMIILYRGVAPSDLGNEIVFVFDSRDLLVVHGNPFSQGVSSESFSNHISPSLMKDFTSVDNLMIFAGLSAHSSFVIAASSTSTDRVPQRPVQFFSRNLLRPEFNPLVWPEFG